MRIVLYICCIALLTACRNEAGPPLPGNGGPKADSKYAGILAKCKAITIDTLPVYGFEYNKEDFPLPEDLTYFKKMNDLRNAYLYKGVNVDTAEAQLFPADITQAFLNGGGEISACYSFAITDKYTGIIARTPAMYESSSVKLFILDNEKDTITNFMELADVWGDAGDFVQKQSWLYRDNTMKLHAFMWVAESYDHSVEDEKDTTVERNNYHYVLQLSGSAYDTINRNAGALLKTFEAVNRK